MNEIVIDSCQELREIIIAKDCFSGMKRNTGINHDGVFQIMNCERVCEIKIGKSSLDNVGNVFELRSMHSSPYWYKDLPLITTITAGIKIRIYAAVIKNGEYNYREDIYDESNLMYHPRINPYPTFDSISSIMISGK